MKTTTNSRAKDFASSNDGLKKAKKLEPIKKNSKESKSYLRMDFEDEDEDFDYRSKKHESILDYYDDGDEDLDLDEDDEYDEDEDDEEYDDEDEELYDEDYENKD